MDFERINAIRRNVSPVLLSVIAIVVLFAGAMVNAGEMERERAISLVGGYNYRDLGGLVGAGGKRVAWNKLIRADSMEGLTDADLTVLASIPIKTIIDFRTPTQSAEAPDRLPATVVNRFQIPMTFGNLNHAIIQETTDADILKSLMRDAYGKLLQREEIIAAFREFFSRILEPDNHPVLFHCTAGKDRTGVATALILFSLGVDKEAIMKDYEETNVHLAGKYGHLTRERPELASVYSADPIFLTALIESVEREHGSMNAFLASVLQVDTDMMQSLFLAGD